MERRQEITGPLFIVCGVALIALTPVFRRLLWEQAGWRAIQVAGARGFFGALALGLVLRSKIFEIRGAPAAVASLIFVFGVGGVLYVQTLALVSPGIVITILNLCPLWVASYERFFGEKTKNPRLVFALPLGFFGTMFLTMDMDWSQSSSVIGLVIAFFISFMYALYVLASRKAAAAGINIMAPAFWGLVLMALIAAPSSWSAHWSALTFTEAAVMGVLTGGTGFALILLGVSRTRTAVEASLLQYMEIVFVWLYFTIGFREPIAWYHVTGVACIVGSSIFVSVNGRTSHPS